MFDARTVPLVKRSWFEEELLYLLMNLTTFSRYHIRQLTQHMTYFTNAPATPALACASLLFFSKYSKRKRTNCINATTKDPSAADPKWYLQQTPCDSKAHRLQQAIICHMQKGDAQTVSRQPQRTTTLQIPSVTCRNCLIMHE